MAMNKKEKQYIVDLKEMIEMGDTLLALRFTPNIPFDIPLPELSSGVVNGYSFNSYTMSVSESCSSGCSHGRQHNKTNSQRAIPQFSSRLLALKAMRHDLEIMYAKNLRKVDLMIDGEAE